MFDIGFWELTLISIIGLVVLGPERLPTAIRSVMQWINTAKGMANSVKSEISQELKLHEMNENMIKASKEGLDGLNSLDPDLQKSIDEMKKSAQELVAPYKSELESIRKAQKIASDEPQDKSLDESLDKSLDESQDKTQADTAPQLNTEELNSEQQEKSR